VSRDGQGWRISHTRTGKAVGDFAFVGNAFLVAREAYRADPKAWQFDDVSGSLDVPTAIPCWIRAVLKADRSGVPVQLLKGCAEFLRDFPGLTKP
jgi:hypothetical protein